MPSRTLTISLHERSYPVFIDKGITEVLPKELMQRIAGRRCFICFDRALKAEVRVFAEVMAGATGRQCHQFEIPSGEASKSFSQYEALCRWLLQNRIDRKSVVITFGGGVAGDLGGFAAASVMRGVDFIQVPTTLLAQVDSSVGGKTGINVPEGKNLVGAFHQPIAVLADTALLQTLPSRELRAGYAEIVKYGLLGDSAFFQWLEEHGRAVLKLENEPLNYAIARSIEMKAEIVAADEREKGRRALLNLGHTFGHALEAHAGYDGSLLHGEGVAIGMVMAADLSRRMGLLDADDQKRIIEHLKTNGLPVSAQEIEKLQGLSAGSLIETMHHDKKASDGKIAFILLNGLGKAFQSGDVSMDIVRHVIQDSLDGRAL